MHNNGHDKIGVMQNLYSHRVSGEICLKIFVVFNEYFVTVWLLLDNVDVGQRIHNALWFHSDNTSFNFRQDTDEGSHEYIMDSSGGISVSFLVTTRRVCILKKEYAKRDKVKKLLFSVDAEFLGDSL